MIPPPRRSTPFPYTTLFRSRQERVARAAKADEAFGELDDRGRVIEFPEGLIGLRSEEHTSALQSHSELVCRRLLEKKKAWRVRSFIASVAYPFRHEAVSPMT